MGSANYTLIHAADAPYSRCHRTTVNSCLLRSHKQTEIIIYSLPINCALYAREASARKNQPLWLLLPRHIFLFINNLISLHNFHCRLLRCHTRSRVSAHAQPFTHASSLCSIRKRLFVCTHIWIYCILFENHLVIYAIQIHLCTRHDSIYSLRVADHASSSRATRIVFCVNK